MSGIDITSDMEALLDMGSEMIQFYRNNPVIAAYDLLKVELAPIQRLVLNDMWFKSYTITLASRGTGKTFVLGVNAALHALLYPGYRVGLIGPSFRQSLVLADTYTTFWTSSGMRSTPIEVLNSVVDNITMIQSSISQNTILSTWTNPEKRCRYIKTTKGFELSGTDDHAIQVLDENNDIIFKDLQDITKDDYIVIKKGFNYFGNNNSLPDFKFDMNWRTKDCRIPTELTPDLSYWMGLLVGDGCISISKNKRKNRINFTNQDQDLINSFKKYAEEYFIDDTIYDRVKHNTTHELSYFNKKLVYFLLECGFTKTTALDKKIPSVLKKSSGECLSNFLSGLFDTDGSCYIENHGEYKHCEVSLSTSSIQLAKEIQSVLLNIGIVSTISLSNKSCVKKLIGRSIDSICSNGYKIRITGIDNLNKFKNLIGFRCVRKKEKLKNYLSSTVYDRTNDLGIPKLVYNNNYSKFSKYKEQGIIFVKMVDSKYFMAPTMDLEVENEHCYWAGGFINHNSKMIFSEVEKIYQKSPILREACERAPSRGSDTCNLRFKGTDITNGSFIEALPVGMDGAKIRGSRFYLIEIDELAQMSPDIIDLVLRPMAAVSLEPMQKVNEIMRRKQLIKEGLATEDDFLDDSVNKMVMTSSGYFKFNHMWHRMKAYWKAMREDGENSAYAVHQIPYTMLPEGFLDAKNIAEAKRTMSNIEFMMEYEAAMVSDSEGFFKASLLEKCTQYSGYNVKSVGDDGREYVLGIDPNQGGSALFGMVVIEMGHPNRVVYVKGLKSQAVQDMTKSIYRILKSFNIVRIYMDAQGGGSAVKDLLAEGYNNETPVLDMDDDLNKYKTGKRILRLINFSPVWISDANFNTLSLLENNRLLFPELPFDSSDTDERLYEDVKLLKSQMLNIVVTETGRGVRHFDTPKKGQNKDLYSAILLASFGITELNREYDIPEAALESDGLVRPHVYGARFINKPGGGGNEYAGIAALERKI